MLEWFDAAGDYTAIFTANATGALKHVGESYPFTSSGRLLLSADNHNSVNGIREFARAAGTAVAYAPLTVPELRLDLAALDTLLSRPAGCVEPVCVSGPVEFHRRHASVRSGARAHGRGWDVVLDAAAYVSTRLNLREVQPDFVSVSFYKMFGYPTGVGCLLVRKRPRQAPSAVVCRRHGQLRHRRWARHILSPGEAGFEDGTLNYCSIRGGRDRAAAPRGGRHRRDPRARALPDRLAARWAGGAAALERTADGPHLRPDDHDMRAASSP